MAGGRGKIWGAIVLSDNDMGRLGGEDRWNGIHGSLPGMPFSANWFQPLRRGVRKASRGRRCLSLGSDI